MPKRRQRTRTSGSAAENDCADAEWSLDSLGAEATFIVDATLSCLSLDAAFADLKIGRKIWRQLRAELQLDNDLFGSVLDLWRQDAFRVKKAASGLLAADAAKSVLLRLEAAANIQVAVDEVPVDFAVATAFGDDASLPEASLAGVRLRLPPMPPGSCPVTEGQEERRRALRRRLQLSLPPEVNGVIKKEGADLRTYGPGGALRYIESIWELLAHRSDAEELLAELVCTQSDSDLQRALRAALFQSDLCHGQLQELQEPDCSTEDRACWSCDLPDAQLLHALSFISSAGSLSAVAAASPSMRHVAEADCLWSAAWVSSQLGSPPTSKVRQHFLRQLYSRCVECRCPTEFEHAIIGCRLCECCERRCSRYALVRAGAAMRQYQLPIAAMRSLPHLNGTTGRVYLRCDVEELASRQHSDDSLRQLRARNEMGSTASGRQRGKRACGHASVRSSLRKLRGTSGGAAEDDDPCCFDATALIRANEVAWRSDDDEAEASASSDGS